jgi:RNase P subunit RPR2
MICQRCRGLLVHETFGELNFETGRLRTVTRCINCGCIEDAVVRANRGRRLERTRTISRRRRVTREYDVVFGKSDTKGALIH